MGPAVCILPMLCGERHGVAYVEIAAVVACQHKEGSLGRWHILEMGVELAYILGCSRNVLLRVVQVVARQAQMVGRRRHDLHQSAGTCP